MQPFMGKVKIFSIFLLQTVATVGQRILQYRELKDITLAQLEDITGSPNQTLSRYEHSKRSPNIQTAQKLAETMGVNLLWLMGYDAPMYAALEDIALTADESEIVRCYRIMPPALKQSFLQMARSTAGTIPHEYVARDEESWLYGSAAEYSLSQTSTWNSLMPYCWNTTTQERRRN